MNLTRHWVDYLIHSPEYGMGYHIVDITLDDGTIYKNIVVSNCEYIIPKLSDGTVQPQFDVNKVVDVKVHTR